MAPTSIKKVFCSCTGQVCYYYKLSTHCQNMPVWTCLSRHAPQQRHKCYWVLAGICAVLANQVPSCRVHRRVSSLATLQAGRSQCAMLDVNPRLLPTFLGTCTHQQGRRNDQDTSDATVPSAPHIPDKVSCALDENLMMCNACRAKSGSGELLRS